MISITFTFVRQLAVLEANLSGEMQADTWLHRTKLGLASSETESVGAANKVNSSISSSLRVAAQLGR